MESNDDITREDVLGPGGPLSSEELARREAEEAQWRAEQEQYDRTLDLLTLVLDAGTSREKELDIIVQDRTPRKIWEPLTSGIAAAQGASGDYALPDALTEGLLSDAKRVWSEALNNPSEGDDPYWIEKELQTVITIVEAIEEYGRERLTLRFIADWGEQRYQWRQELKALWLEDIWEA
jgi:hypothetical protein